MKGHHENEVKLDKDIGLLTNWSVICAQKINIGLEKRIGGFINIEKSYFFVLAQNLGLTRVDTPDRGLSNAVFIFDGKVHEKIAQVEVQN